MDRLLQVVQDGILKGDKGVEKASVTSGVWCEIFRCLLFSFLSFLLQAFDKHRQKQTWLWHEAPVPRNQNGRRRHGREVGDGMKGRKEEMEDK